MSRTVVVYHANCPDGFTAAWAFRKGNPDPEIEYVPMLHEEFADPDAVLSRFGDVTQMFVLDFCFPPALTIDLGFQVRMNNPQGTVMTLDHHRGMARVFESYLIGEVDNVEEGDLEEIGQVLFFAQTAHPVYFDFTRSGAMIAWESFNPGEAPWLVKYIQDRDLWTKRLRSTDEVSAFIDSQIQTFGAWDYLESGLQDDDQFDIICGDGDAMLMARERDVQRMVDNAIIVFLAGHNVPMAMAPVHGSDVAEALAKRTGLPVTGYWFDKPGRRMFGLRSNGEVDVAELAKLYGGNGHPQAAGFSVALTESDNPMSVVNNPTEIEKDTSA